ncbi:uncharacterized protein [Apostichopus japonicus]|uniref:uncharacterized protein isoform X2 n=1 Tax=Stichopus japonicus TaxID=307972 RepID=UPI003AB748C7
MMDKWIVFAATCLRICIISGSLKSNGVILRELVVQLNTTHATIGWAFGLQNGMSYLFGIGFGLATLPSYLTLEQHFPHKFSLMLAIACPFNFVGVALLPPVLQFIESLYGLRYGIVLFGAVLMHLIPCGVALREPSSSKVEIVQESCAEQSEETDIKLVLKKQLDQETEEGIPGEEEEEEEDESGSRCLNFVDKYLCCFSSLVHHGNFTIAVLLEFTSLYLYTSWALFLVSLGVTAGLTQNEAVYLASAGGVGGLLGSILAALMVHFQKMNAYTGCLVPLVFMMLTFLLYCYATNFYVLLVASVACGCLLGLNFSAVFGITPTLICRRHFRQAVVISFVLDGLATQFGGLCSGILQDVFKSTRAVYLVNAALCFFMSLFALMWGCNDTPVKQCGEVTLAKTSQSLLK